MGLYYHTSSKHEGISYSCKYCDYHATTQGHLKRHQGSVHEGVRYSCDQCEYQATQQSNLLTHKKSVHEGIRYSCNQCHFHATKKRKIEIHKKSVHRDVKQIISLKNRKHSRLTHFQPPPTLFIRHIVNNYSILRLTNHN